MAIDYRETAPAAATRDMFLDQNGEADARKSRDTALAIGVPGTVAGLALAQARYGSGKLSLAELIAPRYGATALPRVVSELGGISVNGKPLGDVQPQSPFRPDTFHYEVVVPGDVSAVPQVTATQRKSGVAPGTTIQ